MSGTPGVKAGQLRHRVTVQTRSTTSDAAGQEVETWSLFGHRWARVEPLAVAEPVTSDQRQAVVSHRITMRADKGLRNELREDDRIVWGSRTLYVVAVRDELELHGRLIIDARERR